MFLAKRKSTGYYYLHSKDETGKNRTVSTRQKTKADAMLFLREFKESEREKKIRIQNISLSEFKAEYLEFSKSIHTLNSHLSARAALNEFLKVIGGDVPISKISIRDIESFIAIKKKQSVFTARRCFVTVAAAFSKACDWNYLHSNPFRKVTKPKLPEVPPLFFSKDEFRKLLSVIDKNGFRDFVMVGALTGMRVSEVINLKWANIDLISKVIHVVNSDEFQTKSKKSRKIPMNKTLYELLAHRKENAITELVFTRNGRKLDKHFISKRFKQYVLAAGLNRRLHFHSLRHSFCSWLILEGVSIYEVMKLAGHSSVNVTAKYSHLQPETRFESVNKISFEVEHA